MLAGEVNSEVDRLKLRRIELTERMNYAYDYDEREELRGEIGNIQRQIDILEKMK